MVVVVIAVFHQEKLIEKHTVLKTEVVLQIQTEHGVQMVTNQILYDHLHDHLHTEVLGHALENESVQSLPVLVISV